MTQDLPPKLESTVGEIDRDAKLWAMLAHFSILLCFLVNWAVFIAPLIIWLIKKDTSSFVEDQAKEALNFQLSVVIVSLISLATCVLIPVAIGVIIAGIVFGIIGGFEANKGNIYRYPYTFRMIT